MEDSVRQAIIEELERQSQERPDTLAVTAEEIEVVIEGRVNLDELVMAIVGAVAGGP